MGIGARSRIIGAKFAEPLHIAILGIGLFALPAGILASGFASEIQKKEKKETNCPHCGKTLDG